jgi:hypothetical protein
MMVDAIDEDGLKFVDEICSKQNELYEEGMKPGEDIRYKME